MIKAIWIPLLLICISQIAFANTYGSGHYGSGLYGIGEPTASTGSSLSGISAAQRASEVAFYTDEIKCTEAGYQFYNDTCYDCSTPLVESQGQVLCLNEDERAATFIYLGIFPISLISIMILVYYHKRKTKKLKKKENKEKQEAV